MTVTYPHGYGRTLLGIDELFARHHVDKMHPEFARRLRAWLVAQGGQVGIGGSWRATGTQPDRPGFAPEGRSFHQYQTFNSGLVAFCAVDLVARNGSGVHRAPHWAEVPARGSDDAKRWGVHCNIASESWHMQPTEINGWLSWVNSGSRDPVSGYPLPSEPLPPEPPTEERPMRYVLKPPTGAAPGSPWFLRWDGTWSYLTGRDRDIARSQGLPEFDDTAERYDLVRRQVGV
jgi:hypothetical protein